MYRKNVLEGNERDYWTWESKIKVGNTCLVSKKWIEIITPIIRDHLRKRNWQ